MSQVFADFSISIDGFSAGANDGPANPMGDHGMRLHQWFFARNDVHPNETDTRVMEEVTRRTGAVVLGKRMFENGLDPWGGKNPWGVPAFVLTHDRRDPLTKDGEVQFTFVSDGTGSALEQAKAVAGEDDVIVAGGANTVQQFIRAGLLDDVQVHIVPILLGKGIRLFDQMGDAKFGLECDRVVASPAVTHVKYRIVR